VPQSLHCLSRRPWSHFAGSYCFFAAFFAFFFAAFFAAFSVAV
jgi:hypothetical protein